MIAKHPVGPGVRRQRTFVFADRRSNLPRLPGQSDELKVERQMRAVFCGSVIRHQLPNGEVYLANQHAFGVLVYERPHLLHNAVHLRLIGRIRRNQRVVRQLVEVVIRIWRVVAERRVFDQMPEHIDTEAIHAPVQPEAHGRIHGGAHLRMPPIEIRLLRQKGVIVILRGGFIPGPGGATEHTQPVVRRRAVWLGVLPDVPITLGVASANAAIPGTTDAGQTCGSVQSRE